MPNVEIHGLTNVLARRVRKNVFEKFADELFILDLVVTIFPTIVLNGHGETEQFFRLLNSYDDDEEDKIIIAGLLELGMDVEHIKLEGFHPKKK